MATTMHRLQISLPDEQAEFLAEQARRHGVSMAEFVRQLIQREVETTSGKKGVESLWEIAGIAEDHGPLLNAVPVSEAPELYLIDLRNRE
jgi:metal-responsive CopG/Arc/MetJ family transcriptional regulator